MWKMNIFELSKIFTFQRFTLHWREISVHVTEYGSDENSIARYGGSVTATENIHISETIIYN